MRGISTVFVLALSTAVAASQVGRQVGVTKRSTLFPMTKGMALEGERFQPNQKEGMAMEIRYNLNGLKKASSIKRYYLPAPNDMDGKYQLKDRNSAFLIHILSSRNIMAMKRAIPPSCWFQYYTSCPRKSSSQGSLSKKEYYGLTKSMIIQRAVLQALGF